MPIFTILYVVLLGTAVCLQLWIEERHIRYIARTRHVVPSILANHITIATHQRSVDYIIETTRLKEKTLICQAVVLYAWSIGGGLSFLSTVWPPYVAQHAVLSATCLTMAVGALNMLVTIPFSWFHTFHIEEKFGFNRLTPSVFFTDLMKQTVLGTLFLVPLCLVAFYVVEQHNPLWWLYTWLACITLVSIQILIFPTIIAPLFNRFTPLCHAELQQHVRTLLEKCHHPTTPIFVVDHSSHNTHSNAYLAGVGHTRRIVLFDTLLNQLTPPQITAVLAHEIGHHKNNHLLWRTGYVAILILAILTTMAFFVCHLQYAQALGLQHPSPSSTLLLIFLVANPVLFLISPIWHYVSRRHEYEADAYAKQQGYAEPLTTALLTLAKENYSPSHTDALYIFFHYSHPSILQRIAKLA